MSDRNSRDAFDTVDAFASSNDIAVVGMACRFPGAKNVEEFWHTLSNGVEAISFFEDQELLAAGVSHALLDNPQYVKAGAVLQDADLFDAEFFGYTPRGAEILNPQHRLLLECSWEALESTGYDPQTYDGQIGLYAGSGFNTYLSAIYAHPDLLRSVGDFQALLANDKDSLCTTVSYKLNLRGPSVGVQTFCSTSLVAVHMACQSLLNTECDMALAGGVALETPQNVGYLYQAGGISSPDGHCRAFDSRADGTVRGNGVGVVVLKRLDDAQRQGDTILAIIKGSAINNDGSRKVGYTAPSVDGQARVILEAQAIAGISPRTISYIEAHGTGTTLGDPIEIAALAQAFHGQTEEKGYCAIGSVKTNIGHLDAAAGIAGLIKTILALQHKQLPPSLHFESHNPAIDFANSPFYVNTTASEWKRGTTPRRAGVSSFGIGGTNAHVILEEAPVVPVRSSAHKPWHLLVLSSRTASSLETMHSNLADYLTTHPRLDLDAVAYTLQTGRHAFSQRSMIVCHNLEDAAQALRTQDARRVLTAQSAPNEHPPVVFMFPGQGSQYRGMASELYAVEPVFREQIDHCAQLLMTPLDCDLRTLLFSQENDDEIVQQRLNQTAFTQPALFTVEYALAQLWMSWGIQPQAMIGHSVGEYVAACLSGVFSLEDALSLIARRGQLMQSLPAGSMLAIPLPEREIHAFLNDQISLAAVNTPSRCVLSGPTAAIEALELQLAQRALVCQRLHTSHAFHSSMMEPIQAAFTNALQHIHFSAPAIPYISNVTGTWITKQQATDPAYWIQHLREPVRFADGIQALLKHMPALLLEVGPGQTLSRFARAQQNSTHVRGILPSSGTSHEQGSDLQHMLQALGQMWLAGVQVAWESLYYAELPRRVSLPTYPFEHKRYWLTAPAGKATREENLTVSHKHLSLTTEDQCIAPISNVSHPSLPAVTPPAPSPRADLQETLTTILADLLGIPYAEVNDTASFLDMGVDSLVMLQMSQAIEKSFGIPVPFRMLLEEYSTVADLAAYIAPKLPPVVKATPPVVALTDPSQVVHPVPPAPFSDPSTSTAPPVALASIERIMTQQLAFMAQQLEVLSSWKQGEPQTTEPLKAQTSTNQVSPLASELSPLSPSLPAKPSSAPQKAYVPFKTVSQATNNPGTSLTQSQRDFLESLIARFTQRTAGSKKLAQKYRPWLADARVVEGFRLLVKELIYPIVIERGAGAKVWDVDGNEYIDIAMGFGTLLFGHSPAFLTQALGEQLAQGMRIGPHQSEIGGQVAALFCELTGMERVAFCNSGTEAVMAALRLARAVTGRDKVVLFSGSYHGTFDGVLAIPADARGTSLQAAPMCPGVPPGMMQDIFILPYDSHDALTILKTHAHELAAVLVEPLQSRRPDWLPVDFLRNLRSFTAEAGIALIFDEVVTGFRMHQRGIQAELEVQPDIATYGKILGSGLPVGVVAGRSAFMNAIDGGMWNYGDSSYPHANQTLYAGTYFENPLVMTGVWAVLDYLRQCGPDLYTALNAQTAQLAATVNAYCEKMNVPLEVVHHGSLFTFRFLTIMQNTDLFFFHLLDKGIYTRKGQLPCFLSTAHTTEDIEHIIQAIKETINEMQTVGFFPPHQPDPGNGTGEKAIQRVEVKNHLPLTPQQEELWIMAQMGDGALQAYSETLALHLYGPVNLQLLQEALQTLVARHEAVRATFERNGAYQEIVSALTLEIPVIDLKAAHLTTEAALARVTSWLEEEAKQPFDLEHGPLLRVNLLKISDIHHALSISYHHIIIDGWSLGILLDELSQLYSAACQGFHCTLPEPASYRNYTRRYNSQRNNQKAIHAREYWLERLSPPLPVLQLPTDRPGPAVLTFNGACETRILDTALYTSLKKLGARQHSTLFSTLLTAYAALLHRLTGQDDIVIGTLAAGQLEAGCEQLVGHCVNLLPLRLQMMGDPTFLEYLTQVQKTVLEAFDHRSYPFIHLIGELKLPRDLGRHPLVSTVFNFERATELEFFDLSTAVIASPAQTTKFDLILNATEQAGQLHLECTYNTDIFDTSTIHRLLGHYQTLLESAVATPECTLLQLPILSAAEHQQILQTWNATSVKYDENCCIQTLIEKQVALTPGAIAISYGDQQITYTQLNQRANALAHHLIALGIGPETRVGLCMERTPDLLAGILGILKAGGAYVPLDPAYPSTRLAYILEDAQCSILLTQTSLSEHLPETTTRRVYMEEIDQSSSALGMEPLPNPGIRSNANNLAYIIYTSGSTGTPKGVAIAHQSTVAFLHWACTTFSARDLAGTLAATSICFDLSIFELWAPLSCGGRVLLVENALHIPPSSEITLINTVPSVMIEMLRTGLPETVRIVNLAGEPLASDLVKRIYQHTNVQQIFNLYGPSEDTTYSTNALLTREQIGSVTIGRPIANTRIYLLDHALQPVPQGVSGEIFIAGHGLARGYVGRPRLTAERFVPDPFSPQPGGRLYKTGDLARYRADGTLDYLGRSDNQVKLRGFRIELEEIEVVLRAHPAIDEAVVVAREDIPGDKRLVAYLVSATHEGELTAEQLRDFLSQRLPAYMLPAAYVKLSVLPLTPNGKLDRRAFPAPDGLQLVGTEYPYRAPETPLEQQVALIWAEVLNVKHVGMHDNFFELGGHSLKAIQMISRVQQSIGVRIELRTVFEDPTVSGSVLAIERILAQSQQEVPTETLFLSGDELSDTQQLDDLLQYLDGVSPDELQALFSHTSNGKK